MKIFLCCILLFISGCHQAADFTKINKVTKKTSTKNYTEYWTTNRDSYLLESSVFYGTYDFANIGDIITIRDGVIKAFPPKYKKASNASK